MNYKEKIYEFVDKINVNNSHFDFVCADRPMTDKRGQTLKLLFIHQDGRDCKILIGIRAASIVKETDFADTYKQFYFDVVKFFLPENESIENLDNISAEKLIESGLEKMKMLQ